MSVVTRLISAAEFAAMPDDGMLHELVRGEVVAMPPPGFEHGQVSLNVAVLLATHVKQHKLGIVVSNDTGFLLSRGPDTVRGPDVSFVSTARLPQGKRSGWLDIAPDVAIEVLSPTDAMSEVEDKIDEYLAAGCKAVVLVKPKRRAVAVYRPGQSPTMLSVSDTLDLSDVIAEFSCAVSKLFE